MKKFLIILGSLLAVLVIALVVLSFFLGSLVTKGVNTFGPKITQTKVTLDSAQLSPFSGSGTLTGLFVGNPPGWTSDKAFYLGKIHVDVVPRSLVGDHIVIEEIVIDRPEFVYETKIVTSNIKELLANIEKSTGGEKPAEQPVNKDGKPLKLEIRSFILQNATVTLGVGPTAITVPMPPLTLTDLGTKEGGLTPNQIALRVMPAVLANITQAALKAVGQTGLSAGGATGEAAAGAVKKAAEGLKGILGGEKKK